MGKNNNNEQNAFNTEIHYGKQRAAELRTEIKDFSKIDRYEQFILDKGWKYPTQKELNAAYDRLRRSMKGILLSEEEFLIEAGITGDEKIETAKQAYSVLAEMLEKSQIDGKDIYWYAHHKWCLQSPEAIVAYQYASNKWLVNTASTEISKERAIVYICMEYGFEASRIQIIGTPYYDAADWNFIRFDCGGYGWLVKDGELYQLFI